MDLFLLRAAPVCASSEQHFHPQTDRIRIVALARGVAPVIHKNPETFFVGRQRVMTSNVRSRAKDITY